MAHARLRWMIALSTAHLLGSGCLPTPVFSCASDEECGDLGEGARCEGAGYCSAPDANCASGRRFHEFAGGGWASQCTDAACGDGEVQDGEACDDGNDIDGDGCNQDCQLSGQEVWTASQTSPGNVRDRCYSVAVNDAGEVAVIGHITEDGEGENLWVRQYSADGEPQWTWVLDGDGHADEEGWSITPTPGGQWLVAGDLATADRLTDAWIGQLDTSGILTWQATWDGGESYLDAARDAVIAENGDVVAIGYATTIRDRETDLWFQRRSADGQTVVWTQHRPGFADNAQDRAHGLVALPGGDFVGVGVRQAEDLRSRAWVERFDAEGETVWAEDAPADWTGSVWTGVALAPTGELLLAGWKNAPAGDADMWLQRRSLAGEVLWEEIIASPGDDDDKANVLAVDERGGFIVGGEMGSGSGSTDAFLRRYGPQGDEVWTVSYSGLAGDRDTTWGLAIGPDGSVYACGYESTPGTEWDIWVRRFTP